MSDRDLSIIEKQQYAKYIIMFLHFFFFKLRDFLSIDFRGREGGREGGETD